MPNNRPIIIIDDDEEDRDLLQEIFKRLNYANKLIFFDSGIAAYEFLLNSDIVPFLILSDINMPKLSGVDLKKKINENYMLNVKCIPFIYFSTSKHQDTIEAAYTTGVQGYFFKPNSLNELEKTISVIMEYWKLSAVPARVAF